MTESAIQAQTIDSSPAASHPLARLIKSKEVYDKGADQRRILGNLLRGDDHQRYLAMGRTWATDKASWEDLHEI